MDYFQTDMCLFTGTVDNLDTYTLNHKFMVSIHFDPLKV